MSITVKIFTKQSGRPTLFQTREFDALPITIGRDAACTLALDDPLKHISRVHVELGQDNGGYWMSVVSKVNPVMVKGRRYGPGTRLTLSSGDSFEMGEFEVQVMFPERPRATESPKPQLPMLGDEFSGDGEGIPRDLPPPEPGIFDEPTPYAGAEEPTYMGPAAGAPPAKAPAGASLNDALHMFLEGAGLPYKNLPAAQSERLLRDGGALLRAAVEGLMKLLVARRETRKGFGVAQTSLSAAREKNPLELISDPRDAMQFLFDPSDRTGGFLDPVQAVGDASEELRAHEVALMAGMQAAILAALQRFDPQTLQTSFEKSSGGFGLGSRKGKLWEAFVAHYEKLSKEARADIQKVVGRDFMEAYQAQLRRLKTDR